MPEAAISTGEAIIIALALGPTIIALLAVIVWGVTDPHAWREWRAGFHRGPEPGTVAPKPYRRPDDPTTPDA